MSIVRKLPRHLENPFDNVFLDVSEKLVPIFHKLGHTPNMLTFYAMLCTIISGWAIRNDKPLIMATAYLSGYLLDCMDGMMARHYKQTSKFGDIFEHARDIFGGSIIGLIAYQKYKHVMPRWVLPIMALLTVGCGMHIGCQQEYVDSYKNDSSKNESINVLQKMCPNKKYISLTRYLGAGTYNVGFTAIVYYLMTRTVVAG